MERIKIKLKPLKRILQAWFTQREWGIIPVAVDSLASFIREKCKEIVEVQINSTAADFRSRVMF